jgi:hypothetical protein
MDKVDDEEDDEDNSDEIAKMKEYMKGFKKDILVKKAEKT